MARTYRPKYRPTLAWKRAVVDGCPAYETEGACIFDNSEGMGGGGSASLNWSVYVGGEWIANVDYLDAAQEVAEDELARARSVR